MSQQTVINSTIASQFQSETASQSSSTFIYIVIIALVIIVLAALKLKKQKSKPKSITSLVGQRFSGKTQLFISLNEGKKIPTVPSIRNNTTSYTLNGKKYDMIDYIGDNISKQDILQKINQIYTIIHVIDGTDQKTLSDAAMFMYRVLVSKDYQKNNCNYVFFLNKSDLPGFIGKTRAEQKLEDEIQHIKQSRINQGEQNQTEDDYIKLSKTRFKIPFKIIEGSAESNIKDIQMTLQSM